MKKFLLLCLFFLQYQLTKTGAWQNFGQKIQLDPDYPIDALRIDSYKATPDEVYVSANQAGREYTFRCQAEHFGPLAAKEAPISADQLAVNRLRNPLVVLTAGLLRVIANSFDHAPGTISVEERNDTDQTVRITIIQTGFPTDVTSLALSENGNFLCAGSRDGKLQLWERIMEVNSQKSSSDLFEKPLNSKEKECPDER